MKSWTLALVASALSLLLWSGAAGATCPVTATTVPPGAAVGCQTVSVNGVTMTDLAVAAAIFALTCGVLFGRAILSRGS